VTILSFLGLVVLAACVTDGGNIPLPSATARADIAVAPGATVTYQFDFEVEVLSGPLLIGLDMDPTPHELSELGLEVIRSWPGGGNTDDEWPTDEFTVEQGEHLSGTLVIEVTNPSEAPVTTELTVRVVADLNTLPGPGKKM
jgi:hypothetical protein